MSIVALIGRPNVGKSSLFNRMVGTRQSIVAHESGTTRDRVYGQVQYRSRELTVIDVAGVVETGSELAASVSEQIRFAKDEADVFAFVVDAQTGLTDEDRRIALDLRQWNKPVVIVANKADHRSIESTGYQFNELGFADVLTTSAIHNTGISDLLECLVRLVPSRKPLKQPHDEIRVALIGRPNVGKSTLLNGYAGGPRAIISSVAGTTRDTIDASMSYKNVRIRFIDTAGIRRAGQVETGVEQFAVMRSISAVLDCDIAIVLVDAQDGPTHGDARIAGIAAEAGKGLILAVNKWDLKMPDVKSQTEDGKKNLPTSTISHPTSRIPTDEAAQRKFLHQMQRVFAFLSFAPVIFISARTGLHTPKLLEQIRVVRDHQLVQLDPIILQSIVHAAKASSTQVPLIYTIEQSAVAPPTFKVYVNRPETWHFSHVRFIENLIREVGSFIGTPVRVALTPQHLRSKQS